MFIPQITKPLDPVVATSISLCEGTYEGQPSSTLIFDEDGNLLMEITLDAISGLDVCAYH